MMLQVAILQLLKKTGFIADYAKPVELLAGDGSDRHFYLYHTSPSGKVLAIIPGSQDERALAESSATYSIGRHLFQKGIAVPEFFSIDADHGIVLCEYLGNTLLHDAVERESGHTILSLYRQAIDQLILFQCAGREGFQKSFCWDTVYYDQQLMLQRETNYFRQAFCADFLGIETFAPGLTAEFELLTGKAALAPHHFLLHRDFQSRNLMLHYGKIRIIDFQGARFGPLGYDLASLLNDPYTELNVLTKKSLFDYYVRQMAARTELHYENFLSEYYYLSLLRNLQILGAFSFLGAVKQKRFFLQYIIPAAEGLHGLLSSPHGGEFPCLQMLANDCLNRVYQLPTLRKYEN